MSLCHDALQVKAAEGSLHGKLPTEVDLVISGGGFKVCIAGGLAYTLRSLGVRIVRVAGASAGAQLGFLTLNDQVVDGLRWALSTAQTFARYPWAYPEPMWAHFYGSIASEAPLPPPGAYTISLCQMARWLPPLGVRTRYADSCDHLPAVNSPGARGHLQNAATPCLAVGANIRRVGSWHRACWRPRPCRCL